MGISFTDIEVMATNATDGEGGRMGEGNITIHKSGLYRWGGWGKNKF